MDIVSPCVTELLSPLTGAVSLPAAGAAVLVHIDPMVIEEALAIGLIRSDGD